MTVNVLDWCYLSLLEIPASANKVLKYKRNSCYIEQLHPDRKTTWLLLQDNTPLSTFQQSCPWTGSTFVVMKAWTSSDVFIITSTNGNIFRVTGFLCGEFTGHRWIPCTKDSDAELWHFFLSASEPTVEQTMETLVIWDATPLIMTSL